MNESLPPQPSEMPGVVPEKRQGLSRIFHAATYSLAGLQAAWRGEAAFRQLVLLNLVLIPVACRVSVSPAERALLIVVLLFSLIVELFNSAIEAAIDRISPDYHPLSKQAKDMGSAAQMLALLVIAVTWGIILL